VAQQRTVETAESSAFERDNAVGDVIFSIIQPFEAVCCNTRSSTIADGPRHASCQLKSCQLPRNSAETTGTTSPEQIKVMKLEGYSEQM